ncbi:MAG: c-type cytochrome [Shimia sp.]
MDTMTATKVTAALCSTLLVFLLGSWAADEIFHAGSHGKYGEQAYVIPVEGGEEEVVEEGPDFEVLLASADVGAGERIWRRCSACHVLEDGVNGTGPHLYDVVGREIGIVEGYGYSGALRAVAEVWTTDNLNGFLEAPKQWAPGTSMGFNGLAKPEDRANLIAYLDTIGG